MDRTTATPASPSHTAHRPDIEGLRGVAILSLLAVHSFPQWAGRGFIGIDIFVVLSGYLITGLLLHSIEAGRLSYFEFGARRVRRIAPALCVVLVVRLAFNSYVSVGLDAESLHSLVVEAVSYLVWLLVAVSLFTRRRWTLSTMACVLLASLVLTALFLVGAPALIAPGLQARYWPLLAGALLAAGLHHGKPMTWPGMRLRPGSCLQRHLSDVLAALGLLMLIGALVLASRAGRLIGWSALLPTLGTVALLSAGASAGVNRRLLSHPVLRFYGVVSYPLYLWHALLLSLPAGLGTALSNEVRVMILIGSVALAALTYDLLEKPIRFGSPRRRAS